MNKLTIDFEICNYLDSNSGDIDSYLFINRNDDPTFETKVSLLDMIKSAIEMYVIPADKQYINENNYEMLSSMLDKMATSVSIGRRMLDDLKQQPQDDAVKTVKVFRYVRRPNNAMFSNLGGVAFLFEFENGSDRNTLRYSYAICDTNDNFDTSIGRNLAHQRMNNGEYSIVVYDRSKSLVDNVYQHLLKVKGNGGLDQTERKLLMMLETDCFGV